VHCDDSDSASSHRTLIAVVQPLRRAPCTMELIGKNGMIMNSPEIMLRDFLLTALHND